MTTRNFLVRITEVSLQPDGVLRFHASHVGSASVFSSAASQTAPDVDEPLVGRPGRTEIRFLDLPALRSDDLDSGFHVAVCGQRSGWSGSVLYRSPDNDVYNRISALVESSIIGNVTEALPDGPTTVWDNGNTINVNILTSGGSLSTATEENVLSFDANVAAVGMDGRWEIIGFKTATLETDGTYTLSNLIRGRFGTEAHTSDHVAYDTFVLLQSTALYKVLVDTNYIDTEYYYKCVSLGKFLSTTAPHTFTYTGELFIPYAPCHIKATRQSNQDIVLSWVRRSRVAGEWRDYVDVPLVEDSEEYEIDVYDGDSVVRTIEVSDTTEVTYTSAQQTTDFGGNTTTLKVKIYQMNSTVGRGNPGEETLTVSLWA